MKITIRKCAPKDYAALHALNENEMGYSYSAEQTKIQLDKVLNDTANAVFVALLDNEIIGYIHGCEYNLLYAEPMVNILGIAVCERYRRMGVGRLLLKTLENWAQERGAVAVRLNSGAERTEAHKFYEKCGFVFKKTQYSFKEYIKIPED